ncbi:MAG: sensor histidine kinase [Novosphingobium sp.]
MVRFGLVRRAILAERSHFERAAIVVAAVIVPTVLRIAIDNGVNGIPFVTYFPTIVIASLIVSWEYATACAILSAVVAVWWFVPQVGPWIENSASIMIVALFLVSCALLIATGQALRRMVRDFVALSQREAHLNTELQHRVKNMLAVVQALAQQSAKDADPPEFARAFAGRLSALARAHDVLSAGALENCAMPDLVVRACEAFGDATNVRIDGPCCRLPAESCVPLALAIHELGTNALKHGALSADGRVDVRWTVEPEGSCRIVWSEGDGPPVKPPERIGLGRRLLTAQRGLAEVTLDFDPAGLRCTLVIAGAELDPER